MKWFETSSKAPTSGIHARAHPCTKRHENLICAEEHFTLNWGPGGLPWPWPFTFLRIWHHLVDFGVSTDRKASREWYVIILASVLVPALDLWPHTSWAIFKHTEVFARPLRWTEHLHDEQSYLILGNVSLMVKVIVSTFTWVNHDRIMSDRIIPDRKPLWQHIGLLCWKGQTAMLEKSRRNFQRRQNESLPAPRPLWLTEL